MNTTPVKFGPQEGNVESGQYKIIMCQAPGFGPKYTSELETMVSTSAADIVLLSDLLNEKKDLPCFEGYNAFRIKNSDHRRSSGAAILVRYSLGSRFDQLPVFVDEEQRYILLFDREKRIAIGVLNAEVHRFFHLVGSLGVCGLPFIVGVSLVERSQAAGKTVNLLKGLDIILRSQGLYLISKKTFDVRNKVVYNCFISNVNYKSFTEVHCLNYLPLHIHHSEFLTEFNKITESYPEEEVGRVPTTPGNIPYGPRDIVATEYEDDNDGSIEQVDLL